MVKTKMLSLECMRAKNDLVTFKCVDCSKTYEKTFDEDLSKKSYQLCDGNFNNFC